MSALSHFIQNKLAYITVGTSTRLVYVRSIDVNSGFIIGLHAVKSNDSYEIEGTTTLFNLNQVGTIELAQ